MLLFWGVFLFVQGFLGNFWFCLKMGETMSKIGVIFKSNLLLTEVTGAESFLL